MLVNAGAVYGYGYRYNAVVQYSRNDTVGRRYCRLHRRSIYIDIVMLFAVFRRSERARRVSTMTVCNGAVLELEQGAGCGLLCWSRAVDRLECYAVDRLKRACG